MNLQQTLDQSAAWHLKQLQMLCPEGTTATIILRIPGQEACMVLGNEPDTKEALWEAIRACNEVKSNAGQHRKAERMSRDGAHLTASNIKPNAMVPIGSARVLDTQPAPDDMFADMNGGVVNVGGVGKVSQG